MALRSPGGWPCPARPQGWFGSGVLGEGRGCMSGCCGCEYKAEPDTSAPAPAASANMSPRREQVIGPPLSRKEKRLGVQLISSTWDDQHPLLFHARAWKRAALPNLRDDREGVARLLLAALLLFRLSRHTQFSMSSQQTAFQHAMGGTTVFDVRCDHIHVRRKTSSYTGSRALIGDNGVSIRTVLLSKPTTRFNGRLSGQR